MSGALRAECERIQKSLDELMVAAPAFSAEGGAPLERDAAVRKRVEKLVAQLQPPQRQRLLSEWFGWGPLEPLLERQDASEILVNGPSSIWLESDGRLVRHGDTFLSPTTFRNFTLRLAREANVQPTLDCPFADGSWRDFRVHMALSPSASVSAAVALRRHPRCPWTLARLAEAKWAPPGGLEAVRRLVRERANFLVVGPTGSGKTSVLNACLLELPPAERVVAIEDTAELSTPNDASVKLITRRDPHGHLREIDQAELLRQALRMRPDRIVMGEIRGPEAKDLLMAFATGHSGCMGTLHAECARQALLRLEMLVQLGAPQWDLRAVRALIYLSVRAIVVVKRGANGERQLEGIHRIASLEDVGFLLERLA
jgi:pilus assembly protein CpaF